MLAASLSAISCKANGGQDLRDRVDSYCHDFASDLDRAAAKYEKLAPLLDGPLTSGQRERITSELAIDGIGPSDQARGVKMLDVNKDFLFCSGVRQIDEARRNEIIDRAGLITQSVSEQDGVAGIQRAISNVEQQRMCASWRRSR